MYDVIVIGGGVIGALILRELSKYELRAALLEKEDDVATGATRANSGIAHAGYDCVPGTLKARLNVRGNSLMPALCKELDVPYKMTGSVVVAPEGGLGGLQELYEKGIANGVKVKIIERDEILAIEQNIGESIKYALWAPEAGIVSPYKLAIKAADHAVLNGAEVFLETAVQSIDTVEGGYCCKTDKGDFLAKAVINSAGCYAVELNKTLGEYAPAVEFRRGEYFVLDKTHVPVNTVIFPLPDANGKGILVAPTADGNVIYGPTSTVTDDPMGTITTEEGMQQIRGQVQRSYRTPDYRKVIRLYCGMRVSVGDDFVVKESEKNKGYIMLLGINSPALTSAPAIAEEVTALVLNRVHVPQKANFVPPHRSARVAELAADEVNKLVAADTRYGRVVCRCERVTEGEIIDAIKSPIPALTVDAVKRRVRAGMGRCQGGFCMPAVIKLISEISGIPAWRVKKGGGSSELCIGRVE